MNRETAGSAESGNSIQDPFMKAWAWIGSETKERSERRQVKTQENES